MQVVKKLASDFLGEGRTITADNFFTNSQLGQYLWSERTRLLGTIRKDRIGNPKELVKEKLEVF